MSREQADALVTEARNTAKPAPTPMTESIAVEQAVHRHHLITPHEDPPENMFAPFTVLNRGEGCEAGRQATPPIHWGHVDSGSMVCIVHDGVLAAFPELQQYRKPWRHEVTGVGNRRTRINGKLVGVPLCLGDKPDKGPVVKVTFYILEGCPDYHWLLGLTLL